MIYLADSDIWIRHLRYGDARFAEALAASVIVTHPFVIGELLLGDLRRPGTIETLDNLPQVPTASVAEVRFVIDEQKLANTGIGYVDSHLLVSVLLAGDCLLLTLDKKLANVAKRLAINADDH